MNSRTVSLFMALGLAATLGACGGAQPGDGDGGEEETQPNQEQAAPDNGDKGDNGDDEGGEGGEDGEE
jgi:hypothetical protein